VKRYRKKRQRQMTDFNLLSRFFLEIGEHLGPIAIGVNKGRWYENKRAQEYCSDYKHDQTNSAADSHSDPQNTVRIRLTPSDWSGLFRIRSFELLLLSAQITC
jgi:hypothetical protein